MRITLTVAAAVATLLLGVAASAPADAKLGVNGVSLNGRTYNGIRYNGIRYNGLGLGALARVAPVPSAPPAFRVLGVTLPTAKAG